jgi:membrane-associated phospholipid phosphatase
METVSDTLTREAPLDSPGAFDWRIPRWTVMAAYVIGTIWYLKDRGDIPSDREIISGWFVGLALLATLGRTRREAVTVLFSWLPFLVAISFYDFARALGHLLGRPIEVTSQISVDRFLGGGKLWTERLQGWLIDKRVGLGELPVRQVEQNLRDPSTIRWYDVIVTLVYQSHFIVPYVTAGYLWSRGQRLWRWYAATFVAVNFTACAVFTLWATAPPWYAAQKGLIAPFPRVIAGRGYSRIGLRFAGGLIKKGQNIVNPFAAIPSLHSAQALMVCIFLWGCVWKWVRPFLVALPLWMGFALVYSGEHYLIDVLTGWALVAVVLTIGWYLRRRYGWKSPWRDGHTFDNERGTRGERAGPETPGGQPVPEESTTVPELQAVGRESP